MLRRIAQIATLAASVILGILYYAGGELPGGEPIYTEYIIIWAYVLTVIAALMTLAFPLSQIISEPKRGRGTLVGIGALIVVVGISYSLASSEPLHFTTPNPNNVPTVLKNVGAGLITMYLLVAIGIGAILYTEISKSFK